jgi:nucleoside-diphosphate-sugar epimerase
MKKAFVTGGSGFVGGALIAQLRAQRIDVVALARSPTAADKVVALGAVPVIADLDNLASPDALVAAIRGCDVVFHAAAIAKEHGKLADFIRTNVDGTKALLALVKQAEVPRFVHVSTEAVLCDGQPIVQADETTPYPKHPAGPYPISKGMAERAVIESNGIVIRPRFVWGKGDTSLMPQLAERVKAGKFAWVGSGHHKSSTCHIANTVEGAICAAERGKPGEVYFLTDGSPVDFRDFLTKMLATRGVDAGTRTVPRWLARTAAALTGWMVNPPVTKTAIGLIGVEVTVVDAKARRELGYVGRVSIDAGLKEMTV